MNKVIKKIKSVKKIHWLLFFFFAVYSLGIFAKFGRVNGFGDEIHVINSVLKFFRDFNFSDPYAYAFPVMTIIYIPTVVITIISGFIFGVFHSMNDVMQLVLVDTYKLYPVFRLTTIIFSLITIYYFYKTCLFIFKKDRWALLGAYLLGTSFIFTRASFIFVKWLPQLMVVTIANYFFLSLLKRDKLKLNVYFWAGIAIAASYGVALVGLIVVFPFLFVLYKMIKEGKAENYKKGLLITFLVSGVLITLLTLSSPTLAKNSLGFAKNVVESGVGEQINQESTSYRFLGYIGIYLREEILLSFFALIGIFVAFKKSKFIFYTFGTYLFIFYVMLGPIMGAIRERRAVILIPVFCIFAVFAISWLTSRSKFFEKVMPVVMLLFLINPILIDNELMKDDTIILAREYIEKNIEQDSVIFDFCKLELEDNDVKINYVKENRPELFTTRLKYIDDNPEVISGEKKYFNYIYEDTVNRDDFKGIVESHPQYVVMCHEEVEVENDKAWKNNNDFLGKVYGNFSLEKVYSYADTQDKAAFKPNFLNKENTVDPLYLIKVFNHNYNDYHFTIFKINSDEESVDSNK